MSDIIRTSIASIALALASVATPALAGEFAPVSVAAYQAAVARNQPIIFHVRTKNGPACNAQHTVLAKLMAEPAFADYVVFEADFTANPNAVKMLRVDMPATLIFNRGSTELGRQTGITKEADIRALITRTAKMRHTDRQRTRSAAGQSATWGSGAPILLDDSSEEAFRQH